jgi:hypothetical protein
MNIYCNRQTVNNIVGYKQMYFEGKLTAAPSIKIVKDYGNSSECHLAANPYR